MNIEFSSSLKRIFFYSFYKHNTLYRTSVSSQFVFEPNEPDCIFTIGTVQELKEWILKNQEITRVVQQNDTFEIPIVNTSVHQCYVYIDQENPEYISIPSGMRLVRIKFISETKCNIF